MESDLAIIGISFEFPGVSSLEELWQGLLDGRCFYHIGDSSKERVEAWGSVRDREGFDYRFFGYSYKEACCIDPQQRLLLQHSWHALEDAGYMKRGELPQTALFASTSIDTYLSENLAGAMSGETEDDIVIGNASDFIATRIAYKLGLKGPAMTLQCGCSSALAALHSARVALLTKQCEMALVAAASLSAPHDKGYEKAAEGIRSQDGAIRPFDAAATGTVFTNGVAALVLKPLAAAELDGDKIYGVVASSALNNDGGEKASFTAPSVGAQQQVVERALRLAKAHPDDVALVEAHGTGTALGDPIEFLALCNAFKKSSKTSYCSLQSVKANVGHLDTVSGLAGVIKALLVLDKEVIPPQLHFKNPNPKIDLAKSPFIIESAPRSFVAKGKYAGVTALGIGGTNAHVLLKGYRAKNVTREKAERGGLLLLSAETKNSLEQLFEGVKGGVESPQESAYTSLMGRTEFSWRQALYAFPSAPIGQRFSPHHFDGKAVPLVFLFPGQGSQYMRMGKELYEASERFRERLDRNMVILSDLGGKDYFPLLFGEENSALYATENTQPILFAFEAALASYFIDSGIKPSALIGHSLGEYTALVVSGACSFEVAASLVIMRAGLMAKAPEGAMTTVMADALTVEAMLPAALDVAAYNGPQLVTISGMTEEIEQFEKLCCSKGIAAQRLPTKQPFHSRHLEPLLESYGEVLKKISFGEPQIPIYSNLDGALLTHERLSKGEYWIRQMRSPVYFSRSVENASSWISPIFLEVGPGTTMKTLTERTLGSGCCALQTLPHPREKVGDLAIVKSAFGKLWERGHAIDWLGAFDDYKGCRRGKLPLYPFQNERCWINRGRGGGSEKPNTLLYRRFWRERPHCSHLPSSPADRYWLLVGESSDALWRLSLLLGDSGARSERVAIDGLNERLAKLQGEGTPLSIVYFLKKGEDASFERGAIALLHLLQWAKKNMHVDSVVELTLVTEGVIGFMAEPEPELALLQSSVKAINQEFPTLSTRMIDSDGSCPKELFYETLRRREQTLLLLRGGAFFVERFEPLQLTAPSMRRVKSAGAIVILGGTGHVGIQYARALLDIAEAPIILVQRSPVANIENPKNERERRKKTALENLAKVAPGRVVVKSADIGKGEELNALFEGVIDEVGAIDTVVHTAGVDASMHYRLIKDVEISFFNDCFYAKRFGLINLAEAATRYGVANCHVISSISSALAGIGMYVYSAMHAYIDSFVERMNRRQKARWSYVNWEAWDVGASEEEPELFQQGSFGGHLDRLAIGEKVGIDLIKSFWSSINGGIIVSSEELNGRYEEWVEGKVELGEAEEVLLEKAARPELFVDFIAPGSGEERRLSAIWSNILAVEKIGIDDNFFELGGHSLMALQMIAKINKEFKKSLSIVDLFEASTIRKLSSLLLSPAKERKERELAAIEKRGEARKGRLRRCARDSKERAQI